MLTFEEWCERKGIDLTPDGKHPTDNSPTFSGDWFVKRRVPMVVACTGCEMTMCVFSARIDESEHTWCKTCSGVENETQPTTV